MTDDHLQPSAGEKSCDRCGSFDVLEIAGQFLCTDCVALAGCGCAGHDTEAGAP
jgi:hypothetical protein